MGKHPIPSRTRQLSPPSVKVVLGELSVRIARGTFFSIKATQISGLNFLHGEETMKFVKTTCFGLFFSFLIGIGWAEMPAEFIPVCDRSPLMQNFIVAELKIPCEKITAEDLAKITEIDLAGYGIKKLQNNDFNGFTHLEKLDLSNNHLNNLHQDFFFFPESLRELYLQNNSLKEGIHYKVLEKLPKLAALNISNNQMHIVPDLRANAQLRIFYASNNPFSFLPDDVFSGNRNLVRIFLDNIGLNNLPHKIFDGLFKLEQLELSSNRLDTFLGFQVFSQTPSLRYLSLRRNRLDSFPTNLVLLPKLVFLYLDDNNISYFPDNVVLPPSLKRLDLERNPILSRPQWLKSFQNRKDASLYLPSRCGALLRSLFSFR